MNIVKLEKFINVICDVIVILPFNSLKQQLQSFTFIALSHLDALDISSSCMLEQMLDKRCHKFYNQDDEIIILVSTHKLYSLIDIL